MQSEKMKSTLNVKLNISTFSSNFPLFHPPLLKHQDNIWYLHLRQIIINVTIPIFIVIETYLNCQRPRRASDSRFERHQRPNSFAEPLNQRWWSVMVMMKLIWFWLCTKMILNDMIMLIRGCEMEIWIAQWSKNPREHDEALTFEVLDKIGGWK